AQSRAPRRFLGSAKRPCNPLRCRRCARDGRGNSLRYVSRQFENDPVLGKPPNDELHKLAELRFRQPARTLLRLLTLAAERLAYLPPEELAEHEFVDVLFRPTPERFSAALDGVFVEAPQQGVLRAGPA